MNIWNILLMVLLISVYACTDRYKLIHFYNDIDEWELYDLEEDPQEMRNVYGDPGYKEAQKEMHEILLKLATDYRDEVRIEQARRSDSEQ